MNCNKNKFIKNNGLTVRKQSNIEKILCFFRRIFQNNKEKNNVSSYQLLEFNKDNQKQNFQNNIRVECDFEKERLLNLQKQFENNKITEEEISENDKIELKGLYYMQMLKSKIKINIYKERIAKNKI